MPQDWCYDYLLLDVREREIEYSYWEGMNEALYCCYVLIFDYKLKLLPI